MRVTNNVYTDSVILKYSRTLQAMNADMPKRFDSVLSEANMRIANTGRDTLITETAQRYSRIKELSGRDRLIAETAQTFSQAMNVSGRYDTVLSAYTRNGGATCV